MKLFSYHVEKKGSEYVGDYTISRLTKTTYLVKLWNNQIDSPLKISCKVKTSSLFEKYDLRFDKRLIMLGCIEELRRNGIFNLSLNC